MELNNKRLYRSEENKVLFGVFGGLGEYFEIDPVLLRVLFIILSMFMAFVPGVLAYILMALVIPRRPEHIQAEAKEVPKSN